MLKQALPRLVFGLGPPLPGPTGRIFQKRPEHYFKFVFCPKIHGSEIPILLDFCGALFPDWERRGAKRARWGARGGHGAVREVIDHILQAQGYYDLMLDMFVNAEVDEPSAGDLQR